MSNQLQRIEAEPLIVEARAIVQGLKDTSDTCAADQQVLARRLVVAGAMIVRLIHRLKKDPDSIDWRG